MGAVIDGIGTSRLTIEGSRSSPCQPRGHTRSAEAATYLAAVRSVEEGKGNWCVRTTWRCCCAARGDGMEWQEDEDGLTARVLERLQSVDVLRCLIRIGNRLQTLLGSGTLCIPRRGNGY